MRPYLKKKKKITKRDSGVAQDVGLEFKPQYRKNKKKTLKPVWMSSFESCMEFKSHHSVLTTSEHFYHTGKHIKNFLSCPVWMP
jgi:hypothetical protein